MKPNEEKVPQTFDHHILLYAKGWYNKSGNILEDLKILLSNYAKIDASTGDVKECLANCFAKYCPESDRGRAIQEMIGWSWYSLYPSIKRTPEQIMIGTLSIADGKYVDPTKLQPVRIKKGKEKK
jgi:hypothetical protein